MNSLWGLPDSVEVCGASFSVCTDFRDILEIISVLKDRNESPTVKAIVAMSLFYDHFELVPEDQYGDAMAAMLDFIALGEEDDGIRRPKLIDWDQDAPIIVSEINKVSGHEVRALEYLHWWTFIGYFQAIGEGQLSYVVGIRNKIQSGKRNQLDKGEREFYRMNPKLIDFDVDLSQAEEETLNMWCGK